MYFLHQLRYFMKVSSNFLKFSHVQGGNFSVLHTEMLELSLEKKLIIPVGNTANIKVPAMEENNVS